MLFDPLLGFFQLLWCLSIHCHRGCTSSARVSEAGDLCWSWFPGSTISQQNIVVFHLNSQIHDSNLSLYRTTRLLKSFAEFNARDEKRRRRRLHNVCRTSNMKWEKAGFWLGICFSSLISTGSALFEGSVLPVATTFMHNMCVCIGSVGLFGLFITTRCQLITVLQHFHCNLQRHFSIFLDFK